MPRGQFIGNALLAAELKGDPNTNLPDVKVKFRVTPRKLTRGEWHDTESFDISLSHWHNRNPNTGEVRVNARGKAMQRVVTGSRCYADIDFVLEVFSRRDGAPGVGVDATHIHEFHIVDNSDANAAPGGHAGGYSEAPPQVAPPQVAPPSAYAPPTAEEVANAEDVPW